MKKHILWSLILCVCLVFGGCAKEEEEEKVLDVSQGETLSTMFFDITVNSTKTTHELNEIITHEGYVFLIVNMTITNTTENTISMADSDFWLVVDDDEENYEVALSAYDDIETLIEDELEPTYEIGAGESKTGSLLFVVKEEGNKYVLKTQDIYMINNEEEVNEGDIYTITLRLEPLEPSPEETPAEGEEEVEEPQE